MKLNPMVAGIVGGVVAIAAGVAWWVYIPPGQYTIRQGYLISASKADLETALRYRQQGDSQAVEALKTDGKVRATQGEGKAYVEGCEGLTCSIVRIRGEGMTFTVYVGRNAVKRW